MDVLQRVRSVIPARSLPGIVEKRVDALWADDAFRAQQEAHMRFLLEHTERADEVPELARRYSEQSMLRTWMRWHPRLITRQRVEGVEWLTTKRDESRPAILSFMHHHRYDGMFGSLKRAGADVHCLVLADAMADDAPAQIKQHVRVVAKGGPILPTTGGTAAVVEALRPGVTMAIASDVPGQTPVEFLGRKVLGSFGAARIATITDSPVVLITVVRDGEDSHYLQVHPPLEPRDFADPGQLLAEMLRRHGEAVLAWPEALDTPLARFGQYDA